MSHDVVSIHAPVKGRHVFCVSLSQRLCFNPRPREGATYMDPFKVRDKFVFQSTPP